MKSFRYKLHKFYWNLSSKRWDKDLLRGNLEQELCDYAAYITSKLSNKNSVIIDLGCGTGLLDIILAKQGFDVTGFDFAQAMISRATNNIPASANLKTKFNQQDINQPLQSSSAPIDLIIFRYSFFALVNPATTISQLHQLCSKNGIVLVTEKLHSQKKSIGRFIKNIVLGKKNKLNEEKITNLFLENGFELKEKNITTRNYSLLFEAVK